MVTRLLSFYHKLIHNGHIKTSEINYVKLVDKAASITMDYDYSSKDEIQSDIISSAFQAQQDGTSVIACDSSTYMRRPSVRLADLFFFVRIAQGLNHVACIITKVTKASAKSRKWPKINRWCWAGYIWLNRHIVSCTAWRWTFLLITREGRTHCHFATRIRCVATRKEVNTLSIHVESKESRQLWLLRHIQTWIRSYSKSTNFSLWKSRMLQIFSARQRFFGQFWDIGSFTVHSHAICAEISSKCACILFMLRLRHLAEEFTLTPLPVTKIGMSIFKNWKPSVWNG